MKAEDLELFEVYNCLCFISIRLEFIIINKDNTNFTLFFKTKDVNYFSYKKFRNNFVNDYFTEIQKGGAF